MRIGIAYNLKSDVYNIQPEHLLVDDAFEEFDSEETIESIASVFEKNGHSVLKLGWGKEALKQLLSQPPDFVFNISEGYWGRNRESQMPALFEMLDIPYSGSDPLSLSLALDKITAKKILRQNNIKTPAYYVVNGLDDIEIVNAMLKYPLFVKPAWEGSSKGIQYNSKIYNKEDLAMCVEYLLKNYINQPILIEEYIAGREFTVGVLGNDTPSILGIMQISPAKAIGRRSDFFYSKEVKRDWQNLVSYECPPKIAVSLKKALERTALEAFRAFGCRDISRVDLRVDDSDNVYLLEINPLPGLSPTYSDIVIMARAMGWTYQRLIMEIFNNAIRRTCFYEAHTSYRRSQSEAE